VWKGGSAGEIIIIRFISSTVSMDNKRFHIPLIITSALVLLLGIAELVASAVLIKNSGGNYSGGIYAGIICLMTGTRGLYVRSGPERTRLIQLSILSVISFILSIIAAAIQSNQYSFLQSVESCDNSSLTCYGNSAYCPASYICQKYTFEFSEDCACVTSSCNPAEVSDI
jgi:hypothetical protein